MSSSHFDRIDVETVIRSYSWFATVSTLRIKEAILKESQESEIDLAVFPPLETDFAHIQTLLRGDYSMDSLIHGVSACFVSTYR